MSELCGILFWTSLWLLCWCYFVYPFLVIVIARLLPSPKINIDTSNGSLPAVTIVIAAYNEEGEIATRIKNILEQDYPSSLMKIIIASDGSTDRTIEIARSILDSRVEVLDFPVRQGKANLLNQLVPIVSTPLVAFSDANTIWESGVLRILVRCLDNPKVGVATGQLIMQSKDKKEIASQEAYYVDLESLLRWSESQLGGTLGAYGSVYSLRKDQFIPFPPNTAVDDFYEAMMLAGKGLRTLCLPQARAYEYTSTHTRGEFRRRVRIGTGDFQNLFRLVRLLLPDKGFLALAFLSHKVLRWIGPFFLLFMWLSSAYLAFSISLTFWQWSFWVQTAWHGLALLSWAVISFGFSRLKLLFIPYYFDLINLALFLGFFRAILKAQAAAWQKGR